MKTLGDAWDWYTATRDNLARMRRLGEKHWDDPSLEPATIWQDDQFKMLQARAIVAQTEFGLRHIDDLAIVVLFSVFESHVRDYLTEVIKPQADSITDPILKEAVDDAVQGVKEGSFYARVLEPLKSRISPDQVTQVDQIRKYRNWVAHGRREDAPSNVTPKAAFDRLAEFLVTLGISVQTQENAPKRKRNRR